MIIVTGGAGFIGSNLVRRLAERGEDVVVVDDPDSPQMANLAGVALVDLLSPTEFLTRIERGDPIIGRSEGVVHLGACTRTTATDAEQVMAVNVDLPTRLLAACASARRPMVYASSAAVYGRAPECIEREDCEQPLSLYARSKLAFDRVVRESLAAPAAPLVGLRYFNVYGPGEEHKADMSSVVRRFHDEVRMDGCVRVFGAGLGFGAGEHRRDFVHVDDAVSVTLWFLDGGPSGIFNCGTGSSRTFDDVARVVIRCAGVGRIEHVAFPEGLRHQYQPDTRADLGALRRAGYVADFIPMDVGVPRYLRVRDAPTTRPRRGP